MTNKPAITIQINSASALESLLGDSSDELQIELRRNIAADFGEKYIKHLVRGVIGDPHDQQKFNYEIRKGIAEHLTKKQIEDTLDIAAGKAVEHIIDPENIKQKYKRLEERLDKIEKAADERCKQFEKQVKENIDLALDRIAIEPLVEEISDEIQTVAFRNKVKTEVRQVLENARKLYS